MVNNKRSSYHERFPVTVIPAPTAKVSLLNVSQYTVYCLLWTIIGANLSAPQHTIWQLEMVISGPCMHEINMIRNGDNRHMCHPL